MQYLNLLYIVSTVLLIIGLRRLSHPGTARAGNIIAAAGMGLAILVSMVDPLAVDYGNYLLIIAAILLGSALGLFFSKKVEMTAMPELVSLFNGFGGACAMAIASLEIYKSGAEASVGNSLASVLALFVGGVAFTGSIIAYGKLAGKINDWRGSVYAYINVIWLVLCVIAIGIAVIYPNAFTFLPILLMAGAMVYGVTLVQPIGGADMPVVISLLNAFTGVAAALSGIVYDNMVMILGGILVGSSGTILTVLMCKAMNRSLLNVIVGGFGGTSDGSSGSDKKEVKVATANDTAILLRYAKNVMVIPGYGMAVAQAQKAAKELDNFLSDRGVNVNYAIHPVAGRMPGHMNVLLAEADVPYDKLKDLEDANNMFKDTDISLVVGANDVVNPAALTDPGSPIYGMPVLELLNSNNVIVMKRSMNTGYSGIQNPLFFHEKTQMLFGDAKSTIESLIQEVKMMD